MSIQGYIFKSHIPGVKKHFQKDFQSHDGGFFIKYIIYFLRLPEPKS